MEWFEWSAKKLRTLYENAYTFTTIFESIKIGLVAIGYAILEVAATWRESSSDKNVRAKSESCGREGGASPIPR